MNLEDFESMLVDRVLAEFLEEIKRQKTLHCCPVTHPYFPIFLELAAPCLDRVGRVMVGGVEMGANRKYSCGCVTARDSPPQLSS